MFVGNFEGDSVGKMDGVEVGDFDGIEVEGDDDEYGTGAWVGVDESSHDVGSQTPHSSGNSVFPMMKQASCSLKEPPA